METPTSGWRIKQLSWPNGTIYWEVHHPSGMRVGGKRGGTSKFYDKQKAINVRREMNGQAPLKEPIVIDL